MAGHGAPKGVRQGGRQKGTPNKITADIKAAARMHGAKMIDVLVNIALTSETEAARVSAAKEVLDRGYGKSAQPITGEGGEGPIKIKAAIRFVRST